jgi:hypothetical protein
MHDPVRDPAALIAGMEPQAIPGAVVFAVVPEADLPAALPAARAMIREAEGITLVLPADHPAVPPGAARFAQITLGVHSALDAVGLTAAAAGALAAASIPCNVIAGAHHDHIFVPEAQAATARDALRARAASGLNGAPGPA